MGWLLLLKKKKNLTMDNWPITWVDLMWSVMSVNYLCWIHICHSYKLMAVRIMYFLIIHPLRETLWELACVQPHMAVACVALKNISPMLIKLSVKFDCFLRQRIAPSKWHVTMVPREHAVPWCSICSVFLNLVACFSKCHVTVTGCITEAASK